MIEQELFDFLENTADAAFAVSECGEIRSWNKSAEQLFGYRAPDAVGRSCHDVLNGRGALGTSVCLGRCSVQQQAMERRLGDFDLEVRAASGGRFWVNISTLFFEDRRRGRRLIVHLARDISERKRKEALLAGFVDQAREIAAAADAAAVQAAPVSPLSEQETRILRLFAGGQNSAEIARQLSITLPTLRNHIHGVNEKLRTHSRLEAVMHAMKRGLI